MRTLPLAVTVWTALATLALALPWPAFAAEPPALATLLHAECSDGTRLARPGALAAAEAAARHPAELSAEVFLRLWKVSCNFNLALDGAKGVRRGTYREKSFQDYYAIFAGKCRGRASAMPAEALQFAAAVRVDQIDPATFRRSMERSCSFARAFRTAERKTSRAPSFLEPPVVDDGQRPGI